MVVFAVIECNFEEHHLCGYSNSWNPNVNWYVGGSVARDPESNLLNYTHNNQRGICTLTHWLCFHNLWGHYMVARQTVIGQCRDCRQAFVAPVFVMRPAPSALVSCCLQLFDILSKYNWWWRLSLALHCRELMQEWKSKIKGTAP